MVWDSSPYLAVLTEQDACASIQRTKETLGVIEQATKDGGVNLVVVRVASGSGHEFNHRKWMLLKSLAEMKQKRRFTLVVNDDVDLVVKALSQHIPVDGVHVKEYKSHLIPSIRNTLKRAAARTPNGDHRKSHENFIIGTSCHSLQSAQQSYLLSPLGPDYLFVGTCYPTLSHPEKQSLEQLEGPAFPGRVRQELRRMYQEDSGAFANEKKQPQQTSTSSPLPAPQTSVLMQPPVIYAIGGIDERNCQEPVTRFGAEGVAVIRTVMQAANPRETVRQIKVAMTSQKGDVETTRTLM